jgi:hypothetical protein
MPLGSWAPVMVISSASFGFTPTNLGVTPEQVAQAQLFYKMIEDAE